AKAQKPRLGSYGGLARARRFYQPPLEKLSDQHRNGGFAQSRQLDDFRLRQGTVVTYQPDDRELIVLTDIALIGAFQSSDLGHPSLLPSYTRRQRWTGLRPASSYFVPPEAFPCLVTLG